jgi:hypothetical protein
MILLTKMNITLHFRDIIESSHKEHNDFSHNRVFLLKLNSTMILLIIQNLLIIVPLFIHSSIQSTHIVENP